MNFQLCTYYMIDTLLHFLRGVVISNYDWDQTSSCLCLLLYQN